MYIGIHASTLATETAHTPLLLPLNISRFLEAVLNVELHPIP